MLAGDATVDLIAAIADADGSLSFAGLSQDSLFGAFAHFDVWSVEQAYVKTEATPIT